MSYILDALRKADAQRARDPARGIHAQPAAPGTGGTTGGRRREHWVWAAIAALVLAAALWMWLGAGSATAPSGAPAPNPGPVVRVEPAPAAVPVSVTPAAAVMPPAPEPVLVVAPKAPLVAAVPVAAPPAAPAPAVAAAPVADRTYSLAELPADVRQALPKFSVSGGIYSENVAQRMLVVDGQVFNEGSEIAPGVVLEQIRPRVALLKFRGLRIAQPY